MRELSYSEQLAWVQRLTPQARRAMRMQVENPTRRLCLGFVANTRDLRSPVTCVGCGTMYEGSLEACPSCSDKHAMGPVTELSQQVARLRVESKLKAAAEALKPRRGRVVRMRRKTRRALEGRA